MVVNTWFAAKLVGMPMMDKFLVALRPIISATVMAVVVLVCDWQLVQAGWDLSIVRILVGIPLGALVYVGCEIAIDRTRFLQTFNRIRGLRKA